MGKPELRDLIDAAELQALMDHFYAVGRVPMAILDIHGNVLVGAGWQDACTKFHRANPESCRHCVESDTELTAGVEPGKFRLYKCKNNMWDVATPVMVDGQHVGNVFAGQFFFADEEPDYGLFRKQAERYGFDESSYIAALKKAPRLTRHGVNEAMAFFVQLAQMVSKLGQSNLTLARALAEREQLTGALEQGNEELTAANEELQATNEELQASEEELATQNESLVESEEELRRLNRTLRALSNSNRAMLHGRSESEYVEAACRIIVEDCGHVMAWVGYALNDDQKTVQPVAQAGFEENYLQAAQITWADTERGRGPTGTAIRTGKVSVCHNMLTDARLAPWREQALKRGYASSIALPLLAEGKAFGALTIYSKYPTPFSEEEVQLLGELADDLAYGISAMRAKAAALEAAEALRTSHAQNEFLAELIRASSQPVGVGYPDGRLGMVNRAFEELTGYTADELRAIDWARVLTPPEWVAIEAEQLDELHRTGQPVRYQKEYIRKDGRRVPIELLVHLVRDAAGKPLHYYSFLTDISDRKRVETALRQSAQFPEENPNPVLRVAIDGHVLYANKPGREWLGTLGWQAHGPLPAAVAEIVADACAAGRQVEREIAAANGRTSWVGAVRPPGEQYVNLYGRDITERRRGERNQSLLTEILQILNGSGDMRELIRQTLGAIQRATDFDAVGLRLRRDEDCPYFVQNGFADEFIEAEKVLCQHGRDGAAVRDAEGRPVLECTCGLVLSGATDPAMPCFTTGGSFWTNQSTDLLSLPREADPRTNPRNRCIHAGYQSFGLFPIGTGSENIGLLQLNDRRAGRFTPELLAFLETLAQNLGLALQRAAAQGALLESERRLRLFIEHAPAALAMFDQDMRYLSVSQRWLSDFGLEGQDLRGRSHYEIFPEVPDRWREIHRRGMAGEVVRAEEDPFTRADGAVQWLRWEVRPWHDAAGQVAGIVIFSEDITHRKTAEQALTSAMTSAEHAKAEAEEANKAKDHFLAVLSHELRTPLTPVLATAEILTRDGTLPERYREDVQMIRRNVELEARLIDDLLDVTRITRGKLGMRRRPARIADLIRRAVEVCEADIRQGRLEFELDLGDAADLEIEADWTRMQQVFWNLLKNAIKFTPPGGRVTVTAAMGAEGTVEVSVSDTGMGIDADLLPRMFNAFEQGGVGTTRQFGGLGLGLTITKGLVEMHGGTIEAFSEGKGKGARFTVKLPVAAGSTAAVSGRPKPAGEDACAPGPLRILLVEDHADTARIMKRLLEADGHEVLTAGTVASALELAMRDGLDVLISDLGLPDGTGHELLRQLLARGRRIPAIALSGYGQEEDIRRSREAGFAAHLVKPTSPERLAESIAAVVGGRSRQ